MTKKRKVIIILIVVLILALGSIAAYKIMHQKKEEPKITKSLDTIKGFDYKLEDRDKEIYKTEPAGAPAPQAALSILTGITGRQLRGVTPQNRTDRHSKLCRRRSGHSRNIPRTVARAHIMCPRARSPGAHFHRTHSKTAIQ